MNKQTRKILILGLSFLIFTFNYVNIYANDVEVVEVFFNEYNPTLFVPGDRETLNYSYKINSDDFSKYNLLGVEHTIELISDLNDIEVIINDNNGHQLSLDADNKQAKFYEEGINFNVEYLSNMDVVLLKSISNADQGKTFTIRVSVKAKYDKIESDTDKEKLPETSPKPNERPKLPGTGVEMPIYGLIGMFFSGVITFLITKEREKDEENN